MPSAASWMASWAFSLSLFLPQAVKKPARRLAERRSSVSFLIFIVVYYVSLLIDEKFKAGTGIFNNQAQIDQRMSGGIDLSG